jgi:membrane-bound lytic murein transglycosylase D
MNKGKLLTLIFSALTVLPAFSAPLPSLLSIKESITDNSIVYPESFETDTKQLMQNWYLQNYTVLDKDVENKASNDVSDAEYIKRLKAIPSVIELPFNQIVKNYIEAYVNKRRTLVESMIGMSLYYMPIFEQALEKEGLPLELKYLPVIESALDPNAVSRVGATGLWQFMIGTGKGLGLEVNSLVDERRDPYRSSEAAAKYLKSLHNIYNDWSLAIAAYNCGPAQINKALRRAGGGDKDFWDIYPYLPRETRGYVPAFIAANYVMTYFKYHNISPGLAKKPIITDTVQVNRRVNLNQIAGVLDLPIDEIRVLNPQFRKDVIPGDTHPYSLSLPSQQVYSFIMSEDSIVKYHTDIYNQREVVEPASIKSQKSGGSDYYYTYKTKITTKYHKVRRGESLSSIARSYGTSAYALRSANGSRKARRGQIIKVPCYQRVRVAHKRDNNGNEEESEELLAEDANAPTAGDGNVPEEVADNSGNESEESQASESDVQNGVASSTAKVPMPKKHVTDVPEPSVPARTVAKSTPSKQESDNSSKWQSSSSSSSKYSSRSSKKYASADNEEESSSSKYSKKSRKSSRWDAGNKSTRSKYGRHNKKKEEVVATTNHTVKAGETLSDIADENGVSVNTIKKANGIEGSLIKPGQKISIPKKASKHSKAEKSSRYEKKSKKSHSSEGSSRSKSSKKSKRHRR